VDIQLSIIICAYNSGDFIPEVLTSLIEQSLDKQRYEIIVVNNNSTDHTEKSVLNFISQHPTYNILYVVEKNQGLSFARNKGINTANGSYISFIDDDAKANFTYAEAIVNSFENFNDYHALGGKVNPVYTETVDVRWVSKYVWGLIGKVDLGNQIVEFKKKYPAGCNMAFRKEIFDEIGLFNTDLLYRCDDRYIFDQIKNKHFKVLYTPEASVDHYISAKRVSSEGIIKLSKSNGLAYRQLYNGSKIKLALKFFDYLSKLFISIVLGIGFILIGEPQKAKIIKIMYYSLIGFISRKES
jgi:glucosyl-dolichyl phosphate glucuronosyltransferase